MAKLKWNRNVVFAPWYDVKYDDLNRVILTRKKRKGKNKKTTATITERFGRVN